MALSSRTELKKPDAVWIELTPHRVTSILEQQGVASTTWPKQSPNVLEVRERLEPRVGTNDLLEPVVEKSDHHVIIEDKSKRLHPAEDGYRAFGQILTYGGLFRDDFGIEPELLVLGPEFSTQFETM